MNLTVVNRYYPELARVLGLKLLKPIQSTLTLINIKPIIFRSRANPVAAIGIFMDSLLTQPMNTSLAALASSTPLLGRPQVKSALEQSP